MGSFQNKPSIIVNVLPGSSTELQGANGVLLCTSTVIALLCIEDLSHPVVLLFPGLGWSEPGDCLVVRLWQWNNCAGKATCEQPDRRQSWTYLQLSGCVNDGEAWLDGDTWLALMVYMTLHFRFNSSTTVFVHVDRFLLFTGTCQPIGFWPWNSLRAARSTTGTTWRSTTSTSTR